MRTSSEFWSANSSPDAQKGKQRVLICKRKQP
jgi:hypothetical protein